MKAPSRPEARRALERFRGEFDAKDPKAVAKLDKDWAALTAFYDSALAELERVAAGGGRAQPTGTRASPLTVRWIE